MNIFHTVTTYALYVILYLSQLSLDLKHFPMTLKTFHTFYECVIFHFIVPLLLDIQVCFQCFQLLITHPISTNLHIHFLAICPYIHVLDLIVTRNYSISELSSPDSPLCDCGFLSSFLTLTFCYLKYTGSLILSIFFSQSTGSFLILMVHSSSLLHPFFYEPGTVPSAGVIKLQV